MELELSLSLPLSNNNINNKVMMMMKNTMHEIKKRNYSKAFDDDIDEEEVNSSDVVPKTLSLFVCNGDEEGSHNHSSTNEFVDDEEEEGLIGWPPINRWRKKMCYTNNYHRNNYVMRVENGRGNNVRNGGVIFRGRNPKSMFVKVKMEGVGIARKVDLSAHHSFKTLVDSLMLMFGKCREKNKDYRLIYEDIDGAWLLAQDELWGYDKLQIRKLVKLIKKNVCWRC